MFFWRWDNYYKDIKVGKAYHLNQNSELIIKLRAGEHIWAITRLNRTYVLAADLVVIGTRLNSPGYEYGKYRAMADRQNSRYFDIYKCPDIEPTVRSPPFLLRQDL